MERVTEVEKGSEHPESGPWSTWSPLQVGRKPAGNDPGDSHEGMWLASLRGAGGWSVMDGRGAVVWEKQKGLAMSPPLTAGWGWSVIHPSRRAEEGGLCEEISVLKRPGREFPSEHDSRRVLRQGAIRTDCRVSTARQDSDCSSRTV